MMACKAYKEDGTENGSVVSFQKTGKYEYNRLAATTKLFKRFKNHSILSNLTNFTHRTNQSKTSPDFHKTQKPSQNYPFPSNPLQF